jgi:ATP-dependent protease HslVU (ClpYQ) peptidase subunit
MTVIAYKEGIIAYDSRLTSGNIIESDKHNKMTVYNGHRFFFAGSRCDEERFIDAWFGNHGINIEVTAFVLDNKNMLYRCGVDNDTGLWKEPVIMNRHKSIGSGSNFATAAMDFGKSAKEAVKYAITRDNSCGGIVRSYVI